MIRVLLPQHLRALATLATKWSSSRGTVTQRAVLDALEARYPMLRGTIRDQVTLQRRAFLRFLPARRIFRTSLRTLRYRTRLRREWSR